MKKKDLKRLFFLICMLLCFFSGCSKKKVTQTASTETTLKERMNRISEKTLWSQELEENRLTKTYSGADGVAPKVNISPEAVFASGNEKNYPPLYPSLPQFGSLDVRDVSPAVRQTVNGFFTALQKDEKLEGFFDSDNLFALTLFYLDFPEAWQNHFDEPFFLKKNETAGDKQETAAEKNESAAAAPAADGDASKQNETLESPQKQKNISENQKTDGGEKDADSGEKKESGPATALVSWLMGEPFTKDSLTEIPVLVSGAKGSVKMILYIKEDTGSAAIQQISFEQWQSSVGAKGGKI